MASAASRSATGDASCCSRNPASRSIAIFLRLSRRSETLAPKVLRAGWRTCRSSRRRVFLRRPSSTHSPRAKPREDAGRSNARAIFIVFDLLAEGGKTSLIGRSRSAGAALEKFARRARCKRRARFASRRKRARVAYGQDVARRTGGNLDGIIAKRIDLPYRSGSRDGMQKIKMIRSCRLRRRRFSLQ